jgi:D-alanyl-D-alanine carboxypeptidase/D-alanyl-D-alanine-endopeptidase (penicillin-binding protein 4)
MIQNTTKSFRTNSILKNAHIGIAVWDDKKKKFVIQHQSDRYFVPASNVKVATLYAALQYLPDSLPSFDYYNTPDTLFILPKADPSLLDTAFQNQTAFNFLKKEKKPIVILPVKWETDIYGKGWSWDDYHSSSMPEKSPLPVYSRSNDKRSSEKPIIFATISDKYDSAANILSDTLGVTVIVAKSKRNFMDKPQTFYSVSRDSVCKIMMFHSNNFFAEQLLLMTSDKLLGSMNETEVINKILSDSTLSFPQKPVWVDGSGLSRYNLFTPEDMIFLLKKMETDFGKKRMEEIFPTGNEGTLKGYYDDKAGFLFAKTGTLSGQISLSGYLTTKKNTPLIFSIMINNHTGKSAEIRKKIAQFIDVLWHNYH